MIDSNMFNADAMKHVPVVNNASNVRVFTTEHERRLPDATNSIDFSYEYAQPKSYRLIAATNFEVGNPFGTPCQVALLYARVNDSGAYLALNFDNNDDSVLSMTTNILDFPGILLSQTSTSPLAPSMQWIDFQNYVNCRAGGTITTFTEFCLIFRRKVDQFIPKNIIPFNDLSQ